MTCAVLGGQQRDSVTVGLKGSRTHSHTKTHTSALSNLALLELELLALLSKADFLKTVKRHIIKKHKHTKPSHTHTYTHTNSLENCSGFAVGKHVYDQIKTVSCLRTWTTFVHRLGERFP